MVIGYQTADVKLRNYENIRVTNLRCVQSYGI